MISPGFVELPPASTSQRAVAPASGAPSEHQTKGDPKLTTHETTPPDTSLFLREGAEGAFGEASLLQDGFYWNGLGRDARMQVKHLRSFRTCLQRWAAWRHQHHQRVEPSQIFAVIAALGSRHCSARDTAGSDMAIVKIPVSSAYTNLNFLVGCEKGWVEPCS